MKAMTPKRPKRPKRPKFTRKRALVCLVLTGAVGTVVGATVAVRAGSDGGERGRPLSTAEAQRFAMARFSRYEASPVEVELRIPRGDATLRVTGVVDYRTHRAVGRYRVVGRDDGSRGLVVWDRGGLGVHPGAAPPGEVTRAAAKPPRAAWSPRSYTEDPFDRTLRLSQLLGADRPENAQLLVQGGARRLREERIGGRTYDVYAGPRSRTHRREPAGHRRSASPLTYWVSRDGQLRRLEARMEGLPRPVRVDFTGDGAEAKLPDRPWGGPARRS